MEQEVEQGGPAEADSRERKYFTSVTLGDRLDCLQVSVDSTWRVLSANAAAKERFHWWVQPLTGCSLRKLLLRLRPDWDAYLPTEVVDLENDGVFLPWESEEHPGLGWNIESFPALEPVDAPKVYFLSLIPGLAPEISASATEEGLSASVGPVLHTLFYRSQQMEARFRQFLRLLPGVSFTQDAHLNFSFLSEQLKSMVGEANFRRLRNGESWQKWVHPDDLTGFERSLQSARKTHAPVSSRFRLRLPPEGQVLYLLELRIPVRSITGELSGYEGLWLDLTRQTVAENRLQQAAWKESLAEISGSLSHDFNNILTGIVNLADLMSSAEPESTIDPEDVRIIRDSARQAQQLIQRIVSLNRERSGDIKLHNLIEIVQQQRDLIRIILPRDVQFHVDVPTGEIPVNLDEVAIRRILLNFATNARDALDYQGEVTLSVRTVDLSDYRRDHLLSDRCGKTGEAAELVFRDNGTGIDPKILHRIFDPYFSTKQTSRGSGLGLYSITQFAQANGFDFGVRSKVGQGTEMILLIPVDNFELDDDWDLEESESSGNQSLKHLHVLVPENSGGERTMSAESMEDSVALYFHEIGTSIPDRSTTPLDAVICCMDHRKHLPPDLIEFLKSLNGECPRVLLHTGFNPDEVNHLETALFELLLEEHIHFEENIRSILERLSL